MAAGQRLICASADLVERGLGVRFQLAADEDGEPVPVFAIRYNGEVRAFVNRCAHIPVDLDFQEGEFFDISRLYLVCSTHGALYDPVTGACRGGPCAGRGLVPVGLEERQGGVYLKDNPYGG